MWEMKRSIRHVRAKYDVIQLLQSQYKQNHVYSPRCDVGHRCLGPETNITLRVNTANSSGHSVRNILFAHCTSNDLVLRNMRFSQRIPLFRAVRLCLQVSSSRRFDSFYCHNHQKSPLFLFDSLTLKMKALLSSETSRAVISNDKASHLNRLACQQWHCRQVTSRTAVALSTGHISHGSGTLDRSHLARQ